MCATLDSFCASIRVAWRNSVSLCVGSYCSTMNRKQRRTAASKARKTLGPWLTQQIDRINEEHRREVAAAQSEAEQAIWTLLAKLDIKEATGRWWYRPKNPCNEIYMSPSNYNNMQSMFGK